MYEGNTFRIPISLKVEKDEMYYNFIKPAREDKSLTKIITYLLRAYYDDEEIRGLVDARNAGEDALRMLNEEIDRIALEHSKTIAQTAAMKYEATSIRDDLTKEAMGYSTEMPTNTMDGILAMISDLSEQVNRLENRMDTAGLPEPTVDLTSFFADLPEEPEVDLYKSIAEEYKEGMKAEETVEGAEGTAEETAEETAEGTTEQKAKGNVDVSISEEDEVSEDIPEQAEVGMQFISEDKPEKVILPVNEVPEKKEGKKEDATPVVGENTKVSSSFAKLSASLLKTAT